jgi:hypothetical protein
MTDTASIRDGIRAIRERRRKDAERALLGDRAQPLKAGPPGGGHQHRPATGGRGAIKRVGDGGVGAAVDAGIRIPAGAVPPAGAPYRHWPRRGR